MAQRHSIVTVVGRNKEAAKTAENLPMVFSEIALGDGSRFPSGGETALENEVHRGQITGSGVEAAEPNAVWFDLYVPANVDTFTTQEIGLFDEDGVLYAVSRYDQPVVKFGPDGSSLSDNTFRILVVFSDTENVVVNVSPVAGVTAENLSQHLPWATQEEFDNPDTTGAIPEVAQIHAFLSDEYIPRRIRGAFVGDDEEDELSHHLPFVADKFFVTANGAVVIELPPLDLATFDRTFLAFDVAIDYGVPAEIAHYRIGGFLVEHEGEATWVHRKVLFAPGDHLKTVRYYTDGTRWFVVIGETTDESTHTNVAITDLAVAFRGADEITWDAEWSISVSDDIQGTLRATIEPTKFVSNDDFMSMVRNNEVYPNAQTANKQLALTNDGAGTVSIDTGQSFVWRGFIKISIADFDLDDRSFATAVNKTYHLRWHAPGTGGAVPEGDWPNGRFELFDLADPDYNPSAFDETNTSFDTRYDDMLIARIITDGSNSASITALVNADEMELVFEEEISSISNSYAYNEAYENNTLGSEITGGVPITFDFARKPTAYLSNTTDGGYSTEVNLGVSTRSRYEGRAFLQSASASGYFISGVFRA